MSISLKESLFINSLVKSKKSDYWEKKQQEVSLRLFSDAAKNIPAYKDFLNKNAVDVSNIKTWNDFKNIPIITKESYLRNYLIKDLCWNGEINTPVIYTSTSGSTGNPFYFLRNSEIDWRCSIFLEDFLLSGNEKRMPNTLAIICFGMGVWIGGLITFNALEFINNRRQYPISTITPGINKKEIINILKELAPHYEQIFFAGYPPFIKDVIDEARNENISFKGKIVKVKFAAEAISEGLRDYITKKANIRNKFLDTVNFYGSADIGAMAIEGPTSILVKHLINGNRKIFNDIFSPINRIPTLAQYNPLFVNFESNNGDIYITGNNTLPLIRYAIGDKGGTMTFSELNNRLSKNGINLYKEAIKLKLIDYITELPFVYVYERDDLSTSFYGLWIYPEWIRNALLEYSIQRYITGKFTLITKYDKEQNQFLELNLELRPNVNKPKSIVKKNILKKVVTSLQLHSSEYTEIVNSLKNKAYPVINFWKYEDLEYFAPGIKQRWVTK